MPLEVKSQSPATEPHPLKKCFLFILALLSSALSVTPCLFLSYTHTQTLWVECPFYEQEDSY